MSNLPSWSGADKVYSNAYDMLKSMGKNGHISITKRGKKIIRCNPSDDMNNLIEALNEGNEEKIKGLMLLYRAYNFDKD